VTYDIELFLPSALSGAGQQTESLGACKIISRNVFVTITEHNGDAHVILLDEISELDRAQHRMTTTTGRTIYPRRLDFPDKIFIETATGHARAIAGDQIARVTAAKQTAPRTGRVSWY
jgi:hypothetical protein